MKPEDEELKYRIEVEAPGFKFKLDDSDSWMTVAKAVVLVLAIVAGVKLILDYL